jgi:hypothetical protein
MDDVESSSTFGANEIRTRRLASTGDELERCNGSHPSEIAVPTLEKILQPPTPTETSPITWYHHRRVKHQLRRLWRVTIEGKREINSTPDVDTAGSKASPKPLDNFYFLG